jgi:hypothetical protein
MDGELKSENTAKLNMLIDDDMQLILMNRTTVSLNERTSIILESDDLQGVEPSFLSRVGVITLGDHYLDPKLMFYTYLQKKLPRYLMMYFQVIVTK